MKFIPALILAGSLVASTTQFGFAANAADDAAAGTSPKCAAGDKVVLVNTKAKTYTMKNENAGKASGAASAGEAASTTANTNKAGMARDSSEGKDANSSTTATATFTAMCKSKADAMGAKMAPNTGNLLNSKMGAGGSH